MTPSAPRKVVPVWDNQLTTAIKTIAQKGSALKSEIFRSIIMDKDVDMKVLQTYLSNVEACINSWWDYAKDLTDNMADCNATAGPAVIKYAHVKPYLYAKYDYASVLQFTDGLINGVKKGGKFENKDDIDNFWDHTVSKAFDDRAKTVAGLIDEVFAVKDTGNAVFYATKEEAHLFNAVKNQTLFSAADKRELYSAIEKSAEFMLTDINRDYEFRKAETKMLISIINNVVEYMTYSIAAYLTRIYAISAYALPYISHSRISAIGESVDSNLLHSMEVTIMRDADEASIRGIEHFKGLCDVLQNFATTISAGDGKVLDFEGINYNRTGKDSLEGNVFYAKLLANPLREYLINTIFRDTIYGNTAKTMSEARAKLNEFINSNSHAIQGTSNAKHEILQVLRGTEPENKTVEGYQSLANDLLMCSLNLLANIEHAWNDIKSWHRMESSDNPAFNNSVLTNGTDIVKMLSGLYTDIAGVTIAKARDIEMTINDLRNTKLKKTMNDLTIKIPGGEKTDTSSNDNLMTAVADTARVPIDLMDMYARPTFEYLEMYDEYVRNLPGMEGDPYYEAPETSQFGNVLEAFIDGLIKRVQQFFTNSKFQAATKWCETHKQQMETASYNAPMQNINNYSKDLQISDLNTFISAMKAMPANGIQTQDALDKFIKSLYGNNDALYNLFNGDKVNQNAGTIYQNHILFKKGLNETDTTVPTINLATSNDIQNAVKNWMDNLTGANATFKELVNLFNSAKNDIKDFKRKIAGSSSSNTGATTNDAPPNANPGGDAAKPASQGQGQGGNPPQSNTTQNADNDFNKKALAGARQAMMVIYNNIYIAITRSLNEQYGYIQQAYNQRANQNPQS